jgi:hypothetical protein
MKGGEVGLGLGPLHKYWNPDGRFLNHSKQSQDLHAGCGVYGDGVLVLDLSGWAILHDAGCLKGADEAGNGNT